MKKRSTGLWRPWGRGAADGAGDHLSDSRRRLTSRLATRRCRPGVLPGTRPRLAVGHRDHSEQTRTARMTPVTIRCAAEPLEELVFNRPRRPLLPLAGLGCVARSGGATALRIESRTRIAASHAVDPLVAVKTR
jgi:hypothetical protein